MASQRDRWVSGAFIQKKGTGVSCLTGLAVSSALIGSSQWRGIGQINSGTTIGSVAANVVSGDVVQLTPYMASHMATSIGPSAIFVASISAGFIHVQTTGSVSVRAAMPFAWTVVK